MVCTYVLRLPSFLEGNSMGYMALLSNLVIQAIQRKKPKHAGLETGCQEGRRVRGQVVFYRQQTR